MASPAHWLSAGPMASPAGGTTAALKPTAFGSVDAGGLGLAAAAAAASVSVSERAAIRFVLHILRRVIDGERQLESMRKQLVLHHDFRFDAVWDHLTHSAGSSAGHVTVRELSAYLRSVECFACDADVYALFRRHTPSAAHSTDSAANANGSDAAGRITREVWARSLYPAASGHAISDQFLRALMPSTPAYAPVAAPSAYAAHLQVLDAKAGFLRSPAPPPSAAAGKHAAVELPATVQALLSRLLLHELELDSTHALLCERLAAMDDLLAGARAAHTPSSPPPVVSAKAAAITEGYIALLRGGSAPSATKRLLHSADGDAKHAPSAAAPARPPALLQRLFQRFDTDADAVVDAADLMTAFAALDDAGGAPLDAADCALLLRRFDRDADGVLSYGEWLDALLPYKTAADTPTFHLPFGTTPASAAATATASTAYAGLRSTPSSPATALVVASPAPAAPAAAHHPLLPIPSALGVPSAAPGHVSIAFNSSPPAFSPAPAPAAQAQPQPKPLPVAPSTPVPSSPASSVLSASTVGASSAAGHGLSASRSTSSFLLSPAFQIAQGYLAGIPHTRPSTAPEPAPAPAPALPNGPGASVMYASHVGAAGSVPSAVDMSVVSVSAGAGAAGGPTPFSTPAPAAAPKLFCAAAAAAAGSGLAFGVSGGALHPAAVNVTPHVPSVGPARFAPRSPLAKAKIHHFELTGAFAMRLHLFAGLSDVNPQLIVSAQSHEQALAVFFHSLIALEAHAESQRRALTSFEAFTIESAFNACLPHSAPNSPLKNLALRIEDIAQYLNHSEAQAHAHAHAQAAANGSALLTPTKAVSPDRKHSAPRPPSAAPASPSKQYPYTAREVGPFVRSASAKDAHVTALTLRHFGRALIPRGKAYSDVLAARNAAHAHVKAAPPLEPAVASAFAAVLAQLCAIEFVVEQCREALARRASPTAFNFFAAFQWLDRRDAGATTAADFRDFMKAYQFQPTEQQVLDLFARFDTGLTGRITYGEFVHELLHSAV